MMPRPGLPQQHCAGRAMPADSLGVLPQLCPNEPGQSPLCLGFICDMGVRAPISAESCEDQTHPESHMPPGQGRPWSAADPTTRLDGATHGARRGACNGLPHHPPTPPRKQCLPGGTRTSFLREAGQGGAAASTRSLGAHSVWQRPGRAKGPTRCVHGQEQPEREEKSKVGDGGQELRSAAKCHPEDADSHPMVSHHLSLPGYRPDRTLLHLLETAGRFPCSPGMESTFLLFSSGK